MINEPKFEQRTADLGHVQGNDSLVRCHGRLGKSGLSEDAKRPILLLDKHPLTNLIIQQCHEIVGHRGVARTLPYIRLPINKVAAAVCQLLPMAISGSCLCAVFCQWHKYSRKLDKKAAQN